MDTSKPHLSLRQVGILNELRECEWGGYSRISLRRLRICFGSSFSRYAVAWNCILRRTTLRLRRQLLDDIAVPAYDCVGRL